MNPETRKCPFSAPLVTHQFGCTNAREVVRRGGAEVDCNDPDAHGRCLQLFGQLRAAALPAFGVEDDLLSMPHSVGIKIQHGGLLGLQRLLDEATAGREQVEDINRLATRAVERYGAALPVEAVVADMTAFRPRVRRR